jgi:hypothetical protein
MKKNTHQNSMPIVGRLILGLFFICGLVLLSWGLWGVNHKQEGALGVSLIGFGILVFPVIVLILVAKQRKLEVEYSSQPPKANDQFGILVHAEGKPDASIYLLMFMCLALGVMGYFGSLHDKEKNAAFYTLIWCGGCGVAFIYLSIKAVGSKAHRSGFRSSNGILWKVNRHEFISGQFDLNVGPGSGISAVNKRVLLNVTPKAETTSSLRMTGKPELEVILMKQQGSAYHIGQIQFAGVVAFAPDFKKYSGFSAPKVEIVADHEIISFESSTAESRESLFSKLRKIGEITKSIPESRLSVNIVVQAEQAVVKEESVGLSTSTQVGYGVATIAGVSGVAGALVGAAVGSALRQGAQSANNNNAEIEMLIFGNGGEPQCESLNKIAQEFGWTVKGPKTHPTT